MSQIIRWLTVQGRGILLSGGLFVLAACGDAPTAPQVSIDRVAAARVMPAVTDARVRLAPGIVNVAIRTRVLHDLQELETALANGDGQKARFHLGIVASVMSDYRKQQGAVADDAADISGIGLMVNVVSPVVGSDAGAAAF